MGLRFELDDGVAGCWNLNEPTGVPLSDRAGGLNDTVVVYGTEPASVSTTLGRGRRFTGTNGFRMTEKLVDSNHLTRTMAVEAVVDPDTMVNGDNCAILWRGSDDATASGPWLWGMHLWLTGGVYYLGLTWKDNVGNLASGFLNFVKPSGSFHVACVRRWISTSVVYVDGYVNGEKIGTIGPVAYGTIEGTSGASAFTSIGYRLNSGIPEWGFKGIIEEVRLWNREISAEEIRQSYRRLFVYPTWGGELVSAVQPPGQSFTKNPTSVVRRVLAVEGDALSTAWGKLAELREDFLPDRATATLQRWEELTRQFPMATDFIADRRRRVASFLKKVHGYQVSEIKTALADILALTTAQIEVMENVNRWIELFDQATLPNGRWRADPYSGTITWDTANNRVTVQANAAVDSRWGGTPGRLAPWVRSGVAACEGAEIIAELRAYAVPATTDFAGLYVENWATNSAFMFGVGRDGGGLKFQRRTIVAGGTPTTVTYATVPPVSGTTFWLRMQFTTELDVTVSYSTTGPTGPWTDLATGIAAPIPSFQFAGIVATSDAASPGSAVNAVCYGFRTWCPRSTTPYQWFVYRDPGLGGTPDLGAAQRITNSMRPAHTDGRVCQSKIFLAGTATCLAGRDPVGERT
jgi:hypothetical protein